MRLVCEEKTASLVDISDEEFEIIMDALDIMYEYEVEDDWRRKKIERMHASKQLFDIIRAAYKQA